MNSRSPHRDRPGAASDELGPGGGGAEVEACTVGGEAAPPRGEGRNRRSECGGGASRGTVNRARPRYCLVPQ